MTLRRCASETRSSAEGPLASTASKGKARHAPELHVDLERATRTAHWSAAARVPAERHEGRTYACKLGFAVLAPAVDAHDAAVEALEVEDRLQVCGRRSREQGRAARARGTSARKRSLGRVSGEERGLRQGTDRRRARTWWYSLMADWQGERAQRSEAVAAGRRGRRRTGLQVALLGFAPGRPGELARSASLKLTAGRGSPIRAE